MSMAMSLSKRVVILSFDALGGEDFRYMKSLPALAEFFKEASVCTNVSTIYPSVTYAAHTSIITGKYPKHHGVINNTLVQPNRLSPDWYWQRKYIKAETIYDLAIRKGMKVGAFLWPVTAKSNIQYNIPEIFPNRPWDNQVFVSLRNGSPRFLLELFRRYGHLLDGIKQPELDDFVTECVIHTIKNKAPELILAHFVDLDSCRHESGTFSEEAYDAMKRLDQRFAKIIQSLKDSNLYSETTIIVLGDHVQIDVNKEVKINQVFREKGYLNISGNKLKDWKVLCKGCGGSAYIYINPKYKIEENGLRELLYQLKENPQYGIERIFTREEAIKEGADPNCQYMLEAVEGVHFTDSWDDRPKKIKADHGYHPNKPRYKTFFSASGPGIKRNVEIEQMSLVDIAPTLANLMGLQLERPDGRVLTEIIAKRES